MKKEAFANLIHRLIEIEPTGSPLISCFVNLEQPRAQYFHEFEARANRIGMRLTGRRRMDFDDALEEIREYLDDRIQPESRGFAVFSRWGDHPVFLPMQFEVPMKTEFIVDRLPHIYPLIELKDTYNRFVIAIVSENEARILETTIGTITEEILEKRPDLRTRIGKGWTKEHYRNYREEKASQFVSEKVEIIGQLMTRGGHNHLVLAGAPKMVARLNTALPARLRNKVIDTVIANPGEGISPILRESINLFAAMENAESQDRVTELESAVLSNGLGVCGYADSSAAIRAGAARMLILDQDCIEIEMREDLVKQATRMGVPIETVSGNRTMACLGDMGCLLRFRPSVLEKKDSLVA